MNDDWWWWWWWGWYYGDLELWKINVYCIDRDDRAQRCVRCTLRQLQQYVYTRCPKTNVVFTFVMLWQKWTDFNNFCKFYDKKDYDMHLRSLITNCWSMKTLRRSFYSIGLQFIQPNFRSTPSLCEICWSAFDLMLGGAPYRKTAVLHAVQQNSVCWCRILRSYCQLQIYQRN